MSELPRWNKDIVIFKVQMLFWSWKKGSSYRAAIAAKHNSEPLKQMHSLLLWMLILIYWFVWLLVFKNTIWLHQYCLPRDNPQKCSFFSPAPWEIRVAQFNVIVRNICILKLIRLYHIFNLTSSFIILQLSSFISLQLSSFITL